MVAILKAAMGVLMLYEHSFEEWLLFCIFLKYGYKNMIA